MKKFFFTLLIVFTIFTGCILSGNNKEDAHSIAEKAGIVTTSELSYLKSSVDIEPYNTYFLARKAYDIGLYKIAEKILNTYHKKSHSLIGERLSELFCNVYIKQKKYSEVIIFSRNAALEYPENFFLKRKYAEALFYQHKYKELLTTFNEIKYFPKYKHNYELLLFKTIAEYNLNKKEDRLQVWKDFFVYCPGNEFFLKGWDYLIEKESVSFDSFSYINEMLKGKYKFAQKEYTKSAKVFLEIIPNISEVYLTENFIKDCETSFIRSGNNQKGAQVLELAYKRTGNFHSLFAAARLFRRSHHYNNAKRCLDIIKKDYQGQINERVLWYMLDIQIKTQPNNVADQLDYFTSRWTDPYYFEDILENLCTELVQQENWAEISKLAKKLEGCGPAEILDRLRFILKEAAKLNFFTTQNLVSAYTGSYYCFLSGSNPYEDIIKRPVVINFMEEQMNESETFIYKMIEYEAEDLLKEVSNLSDYLSEWFFIYCADVLAKRQQYLHSIRIMYQFKGELSVEGLKRLYPNVYTELITKHAKEKAIPPQLLSAIVWKESAFEKDIVSSSGAIGLSQLMPATAEDVAQRMNSQVRDLTNPDENLTYGSWYLDWLKTYVGNTALAVISYNGGPGRVKRWQELHPDFNDKLFYESVPIKETHLYGKRVLTAAIIYGMLYYDEKPSDTIKLFFGDGE